MKATIDIPDDLYREVKAKSALEGKRIREVTVELFRRYVSEGLRRDDQQRPLPPEVDGEAAPPWFGILRNYAERVKRHDMQAIRDSIARGLTEHGR